jgi:hypothetical protein
MNKVPEVCTAISDPIRDTSPQRVSESGKVERMYRS